ncbi:unnamed protein product [Diatraea saccharalis]|uniref:protein-tyrosine-phosphatase n=1 Tax=Diatraea saccharalis TaxID=40085 RepID=A0A9N9R721_9NEOP|nr:unnamed protein product [Diatraea saccharalis]
MFAFWNSGAPLHVATATVISSGYCLAVDARRVVIYPNKLITDSFKINSGNSATKRKREDAITQNYKIKMNPHSLNFNKSPSPIATPSKRRILGEIQNISSPIFRPKDSPVIERLKNSPLSDRNSSPLSSKTFKRSTTKITRIFEERTKFKMNKENESFISETFVKLDVEEETRDCSFGQSFQSMKTSNWSMTKLDFTDSLPPKQEAKENIFVPEKDIDLDADMETLQDLEEEFDNDNFDECTKYEIISTDSPNIISRGRTSSSRKINSRNFIFGAPIADTEQSTSFNRPNNTATRMLNFEDENFEFTSPPAKKLTTNSLSVKKSLKFTETPTKNQLRHEKSDSSIGSMSSFSSPASSRSRMTLESSASMESGFISELEEPFLEIEEPSCSPKMANFNDLLSGPIKDGILINKTHSKTFNRSLSFNPDSSKARVSLFSILENPKKCQKRMEKSEEEEDINTKRRKQELVNPVVERMQRPVLQRAFSENNASIMSALARSATEPDLIGDFSRPFLLPAAASQHADLRAISCDTLAAILTGRYNQHLDTYRVIDCRYPYEYDGGHIKDAINLYTPAQVQALVTEPRIEPDTKRNILVFHCEFSLERGPKLSRLLRSLDRAKNKENYPALNYPEVYILHEGYRAFYQKYPDLCSPAGYTAMLDPKHKESLRKHRPRSFLERIVVRYRPLVE